MKNVKNRWRYEHCEKCGKEQRLAWSIDDKFWEKSIVGKYEKYKNSVLCIECFMKIRDELKSHSINITKHFRFLGFVGNKTTGICIG